MAAPSWRGAVGLVLLFFCAAVNTRADQVPLLVSIPVAIQPALSKALEAGLLDQLESAAGEDFALARHDTTVGYLRDLERGAFAVVIDGPHVLAALAAREVMVPVAEYPHPLSFVVVVPKRSGGIYQLSDLAGKPVCTGEMPDLFGLTLIDRIDNPTREPRTIGIADYRRRLRGLFSGQCVAATLETTRFLSLGEAEGADDLRIIFKSRELPGFGAAVSSALPADVRERLAQALLSTESVRATRMLAAALFGSDEPLRPAEPDRLAPLAELMDLYFPW